jgi:hypothetical protein
MPDDAARAWGSEDVHVGIVVRLAPGACRDLMS